LQVLWEKTLKIFRLRKGPRQAIEYG